MIEAARILKRRFETIARLRHRITNASNELSTPKSNG
jgi:hypothetical protein